MDSHLLLQMPLMQERMDRNMRQAFANTGMFSPKMDVRQTDGQYIITMDIPGMDKDKINFGSFVQAIPLPEDARNDRIDANYKNGVLTVTVARMKKQEQQPQSQKIPVK